MDEIGRTDCADNSKAVGQFISHTPTFKIPFCIIISDIKGKGKGKVHPRPGHEDPEG
jgi:hypothetical protein